MKTADQQIIQRLNEIYDAQGANAEGTAWGNIPGTLSNQTDLQSALDAKQAALTAGAILFLTTPSSANLRSLLTDENGTGVLLFSGATSPTFVTPNLGTPSALVLTNATGLPIASGVSGLAADVATFLATPSSVNLKSALTDETGSGALVFANTPTLVAPLLGTPTSGVLTNCTGLPISSGVSGLGTGVATFLATPSSANLAAAVTGDTGTAGGLVFSVGPTFTGMATFADIDVTNGTWHVKMSNFGIGSVWAGLAFSASPSLANYSFLGDGASATYMNAPTGGETGLRINNVTQLLVNASRITASLPFKLKNYTVSTLPAGSQGDIAYVTDALTPTFLTAAVGGGAVVSPVFYNGSTWVTC